MISRATRAPSRSTEVIVGRSVDRHAEVAKTGDRKLVRNAHASGLRFDNQSLCDPVGTADDDIRHLVHLGKPTIAQASLAKMARRGDMVPRRGFAAKFCPTHVEAGRPLLGPGRLWNDQMWTAISAFLQE